MAQKIVRGGEPVGLPDLSFREAIEQPHAFVGWYQNRKNEPKGQGSNQHSKISVNNRKYGTNRSANDTDRFTFQAPPCDTVGRDSDKNNDPVGRSNSPLSQSSGGRPLQRSFLGTRTPGTHEGAQAGHRRETRVSSPASAFYHAPTVHGFGQSGGVVLQCDRSHREDGGGESRSAFEDGVVAGRKDVGGRGSRLLISSGYLADRHAYQ